MQNSLYFVHMRNMDGQAGFADITIQACPVVGIMLLDCILMSLCYPYPKSAHLSGLYEISRLMSEFRLPDTLCIANTDGA